MILSELATFWITFFLFTLQSDLIYSQVSHAENALWNTEIVTYGHNKSVRPQKLFWRTICLLVSRTWQISWQRWWPCWLYKGNDYPFTLTMGTKRWYFDVRITAFELNRNCLEHRNLKKLYHKKNSIFWQRQNFLFLSIIGYFICLFLIIE